MQEEPVLQVIGNTAERGVRKFVQKASEQQLIVCYLKKLCHYNMVTDKTGYLYVKKPLEVERPKGTKKSILSRSMEVQECCRIFENVQLVYHNHSGSVVQ